jgi:hypothetical protein
MRMEEGGVGRRWRREGGEGEGGEGRDGKKAEALVFPSFGLSFVLKTEKA